jgi:hypothetical protein
MRRLRYKRTLSCCSALVLCGTRMMALHVELREDPLLLRRVPNAHAMWLSRRARTASSHGTLSFACI